MQKVEPVLEMCEALDGVQVLVELRVQCGAQVDEHVEPVERERGSRAAQRTTGLWGRGKQRMNWLTGAMYCIGKKLSQFALASDYSVLVLWTRLSGPGAGATGGALHRVIDC